MWYAKLFPFYINRFQTTKDKKGKTLKKRKIEDKKRHSTFRKNKMTNGTEVSEKISNLLIIRNL